METKLKREVAFILTILIVSVVVLPDFDTPLKYLAFMSIQIVLYFWANSRVER